jgi:hypothetical protein
VKQNVLTDIITYSLIVGGILVLTKPGSQGPAVIKALFGGYTGVVQGATGQKVTG